MLYMIGKFHMNIQNIQGYTNYKVIQNIQEYTSINHV